MAEVTSPRVDGAAKMLPHSCVHTSDGHIAKAEGLTVDEALDLAAWLKEAGYSSIEILQGADHCAVQWSK